MVVYAREHLLGEIDSGAIRLNKYGQIVQQAWFDLPKHYPHAILDAFCIMPNHVHGIILLDDSARGRIKRYPLTEIVRAFKSFSARRINLARKMHGTPVWQRNYYEHILRNEMDHQAIHAYILSNPLNWGNDDENQP